MKNPGIPSLYRVFSASISLIACCSNSVLGVDSSMTVVAPGPVSSAIELESRISIRNPSGQSQTYSLDLFVDSPFGTASLASNVPITVGADSQELYTQWVPTAGYQGTNTFRYRISGGDLTSDLTGSQTVHITSKATTRSVPLITAAFFDPGAAQGIYPGTRPPDQQDVRNALDDAKKIGIDTIIVTYSEYTLNGWGAFYDSPTLPSNPNLNFHVVDTIMKHASANGQRVFLGLGRGNDGDVLFTGLNDQARLDAAVDHNKVLADELWNLYRDEPSLYGWYITQETSDVDQASQKFYNKVVEHLRGFEADKPVMVSPSGAPIIDNLEASQVDIFNYQDAVGSNWEQSTGMDRFWQLGSSHNRVDELDQVFSDYESKHEDAETAGNRKHLWANLENWEMDGLSGYANAYPATSGRVLSQLDIEQKYVDVVSSYELFGFMEAPERTLNRFGNYIVFWGENHTAKQLYTDYKDHYNNVWPTLEQSQQVQNGAFEDGTNNWTFTGNGTTQTVSTSSDNTPNGSGSSLDFNITALDSGHPTPWVIQDVDIVAGQDYLFSVWAKKLDAAGGHLAAQVWMLDENENIISGDTLALYFSSTSWDFQTGTIAATSSAVTARVVFATQDLSFGVGTGNYLVDYVSLLGATATASGGGPIPEPATLLMILAIGGTLMGRLNRTDSNRPA